MKGTILEQVSMAVFVKQRTCVNNAKYMYTHTERFCCCCCKYPGTQTNIKMHLDANGDDTSFAHRKHSVLPDSGA